MCYEVKNFFLIRKGGIKVRQGAPKMLMISTFIFVTAQHNMLADEINLFAESYPNRGRQAFRQVVGSGLRFFYRCDFFAFFAFFRCSSFASQLRRRASGFHSKTEPMGTIDSHATSGVVT